MSDPQMLVINALVALLCFGVGTMLVKRGLSSWRTQAPAQSRSAIYTPDMKEGTERVLFPLGAFSYFLGALIATVNYLNATHHIGGVDQHLSVVLATVLLVLLVGTTVSASTVVAITMVGRPRSLVPPHLRRQGAANRRAGFIEYVPVDGDEDDDESARGGYLISVESGAPTMTLTERIGSMRSESLLASVSHQELLPGGNYLLGGPREPTCEVVQIAEGEPTPGEPRRIRRGRFRTIASAHPAGTLVTPVTAEYVEDWAQWIPEKPHPRN
ncbi:hypothetical protein ABZ845_02715 [Streptomyces sp. NPDC047022]|uniref:hypothetical protein n=1 Tax=Streptomyces sp. NPDC047022 TaxID=3155737 RepID=UPI00340D34B9